MCGTVGGAEREDSECQIILWPDQSNGPFLGLEIPPFNFLSNAKKKNQSKEKQINVESFPLRFRMQQP